MGAYSVRPGGLGGRGAWQGLRQRRRHLACGRSAACCMMPPAMWPRGCRLAALPHPDCLFSAVQYISELWKKKQSDVSAAAQPPSCGQRQRGGA